MGENDYINYIAWYQLNTWVYIYQEKPMQHTDINSVLFVDIHGVFNHSSVFHV
jgi:hypothetical protein